LYSSIPAGVLIIAVIIWVFPQNIGQKAHSRALYGKIDWPGVMLSLVGSVLLIFALEEGGVRFAWNSGSIVSSFVVAGVSLVAFSMWEAFLTSKPRAMLPVFPTRLIGNRVITCSLL
jgi:Fungal trichothecene efflux pump (TRI12)